MSDTKNPRLDPDGTLPRLPGWISITRAGELLGFTRQHAYRLAQDGVFKSLRRVDDSFMFVVSEIEVNEMAASRSSETSD